KLVTVIKLGLIAMKKLQQCYLALRTTMTKVIGKVSLSFCYGRHWLSWTGDRNAESFGQEEVSCKGSEEEKIDKTLEA
ncbi:hypothetical protein STEG23_020086, partial [Scotinomys teguina]